MGKQQTYMQLCRMLVGLLASDESCLSLPSVREHSSEIEAFVIWLANLKAAGTRLQKVVLVCSSAKSCEISIIC